MAGGLKLNQLETITNIRDTDFMLLDSSIGSGKITLGDLKKYFNLIKIQTDVDDAVGAVVDMRANVNTALEQIKNLDTANIDINRLIVELRSDVDDNKAGINGLSTEKQDSTDHGLQTTEKSIVGAINEVNTGLTNTNNSKLDKTSDSLQTTSKEIVGAINEVKASVPGLVNDLTTGGYDKALTAEQGRILKEADNTIQNNMNTLFNNVKLRGARGDGAQHSIAELLPSVQLVEVQAINPSATLNDEYDWFIIQKMISEGIKNIYLPSGTYCISKPLIVNNKDYTIEFGPDAKLKIVGTEPIAGIQLGEALETTGNSNVSNVRILRPSIEGNEVGTCIECRDCSTNNVIYHPTLSGCERGIHFRTPNGFDFNTIVNPHISNCQIAIDDVNGGFGHGIIQGGLVINNNRLGLASASWGTKLIGTNFYNNAGTEVKLIGLKNNIILDNCSLHHNNSSSVVNNSSSIFLFDPSWGGVLTLTNTITSESETGYVFKEDGSAVAGGDIIITGGSNDNHQIFYMPLSNSLKISLNSKYDINPDTQPIRSGLHVDAILQLLDANGEFESVHSKILKLEPTDSTTNNAARHITCGSYEPWSVGSVDVGKLKGSIHITSNTAGVVVYIRTLEAVGSDSSSNWSILFGRSV